MPKQTKIGDVIVEYDAEATRAKYASVSGTTDNCECGYCDNYKVVRDGIYPPAFLTLLSELGIDRAKETELTHLFGDDDSDKNYGQPVDGHFAFVGRVLGAQPGIEHATKGPFDFWVGPGVHPTTSATYGSEDSMVDLCFFIAEVPQATAKATK
jgi:hypothetical protein